MYIVRGSALGATRRCGDFVFRPICNRVGCLAPPLGRLAIAMGVPPLGRLAAILNLGRFAIESVLSTALGPTCHRGDFVIRPICNRVEFGLPTCPACHRHETDEQTVRSLHVFEDVHVGLVAAICPFLLPMTIIAIVIDIVIIATVRIFDPHHCHHHRNRSRHGLHHHCHPSVVYMYGICFMYGYIYGYAVYIYIDYGKDYGMYGLYGITYGIYYGVYGIYLV